MLLPSMSDAVLHAEYLATTQCIECVYDAVHSFPRKVEGDLLPPDDIAEGRHIRAAVVEVARHEDGYRSRTEHLNEPLARWLHAAWD